MAFACSCILLRNINLCGPVAMATFVENLVNFVAIFVLISKITAMNRVVHWLI